MAIQIDLPQIAALRIAVEKRFGRPIESRYDYTLLGEDIEQVTREHMAENTLRRLWGSIFFLFMSFAALSTIFAVFENIISCTMELTGISRKKSSVINCILIAALSIPCVLDFNLWQSDGLAIFGGTVMDLEDFLVSNIFLPLGSLVYLLFCTSKKGWGWKNYMAEVNTGKGLKVKNWMRFYLTYILPLIVLGSSSTNSTMRGYL